MEHRKRFVLFGYENEYFSYATFQLTKSNKKYADENDIRKNHLFVYGAAAGGSLQQELPGSQTQ
ncbi:hypothetical protein SAMN04487894_11970 [Niabella drilacis]|uniref:Uncharacterized protein n=1 Tax=Niabella drilacis (strain DSM 25811 / CCM 8410 / CCUG 62505 / LMG 26954 / E90) TaxID=1285928 RepID=A0A1G6ZWK9_NIADE|nr:hypothetical protein SAMN04487894_11970 [Niabella drilacis]